MRSELSHPHDHRTPVVAVRTEYRGRAHRVLLKLESHNPSGSVKDRTAVGLLRSLDADSPLQPGSVVVESTSGNLGIALAKRLRARGCRFIAVIDPKTPMASREQLRAEGAELMLVDEPDGLGGYLLSRLRVVRELCRNNPGYRWTDQYNNPANPGIHYRQTGPELAADGGAELDALYVAVSTGGTLAGISSYARESGWGVRLVAVDASSSKAIRVPHSNGRTADVPYVCVETADDAARRSGYRMIPGIGASRTSSFITADSFDRLITVPDTAAVATCRILFEDTAIKLGGSSGFVVRACLEELGGSRSPLRAMCLSADGGDRYESTIYNDDWLIDVAMFDSVKQEIDRLRLSGLSFSAKEVV